MPTRSLQTIIKGCSQTNISTASKTLIHGITEKLAKASALFRETDTSLPLRLGYLAIGAMFVTLSLWSIAMPLAEAIIAPGTISVSAQRRTIAHLEGGKVAGLHIEEGDLVKADQPLITLDSIEARSALEVLQYQRYARQAKIDRLTAERDQARKVEFREELVKESTADLQVAQLLDGELRKFSSRYDAITAKIALFDERVRKATEQKERLTLQLDSIDRQLEIVESQAGNARELYKKGFGTKSKAVAFQREVEQLITQRLQIDTRINELDGSVEDSKINRKINQTAVATDVEKEMLEAQNDLAELDKKIFSLKTRLDNLVVKSSVEGIVVELRVKSVNDVIKPAAPILDILPVDSNFLVEAHIAPTNIDGIVEGLPVEVRFPSFATMKIPTINGRVDRVSADVLDDDERQHQYYQILVSVDNLSVLKEENLDIIPGMPTEVIIKKKDRSILEYIFAPVANHLAKAVVK